MTTKRNQSSNVTNASGQPAATPVDTCLSHVEQAVAAIDAGSAPLSTKEKKRMLKLRKGGEKFIPQIAALCNANGLELPSHPLDAMVAAVATAQSYAAVHERTTVLLKMIEDNVLRAHSEAWQTATLMYSMLCPIAKRDANVAETLAPIKAFLATGKRSSKKAASSQTPTVQAPIPAALPATPAVAHGNAPSPTP
jgi:hypothetical protein